MKGKWKAALTILYEFDIFNRHQRNKLRLDDVPKLPEWQRLRHQHSSADMTVPNLVIRRASLVPAPHDLTGRKIPTATSVQTTNSEGSSPENNNYLRVSAAFGQRRLSDNVLTAPGHRRLSGLIGSSASSPGSAPGTPMAVGFPIRRHSSAFAANRRYSSNTLLSPSTNAQVFWPLFGCLAFLVYIQARLWSFRSVITFDKFYFSLIVN